MSQRPPVETPDDAQPAAEADATDAPQSAEQEEAPVALPEADELAELRLELETHRERIRELEDQLLRRAADFQNYRRRTQEDLARATEQGRAEAVLRLIDVYDDLGRSLEAADRAGEDRAARFDALREGLELIHRKFTDALAGLGVTPIAAVGQPFDEAVHEALVQQEAEGQPPGTVVAEIQRGYRMGDRILRHARVAVAR